LSTIVPEAAENVNYLNQANRAIFKEDNFYAMDGGVKKIYQAVINATKTLLLETYCVCPPG
jgi:hypothetical protein